MCSCSKPLTQTDCQILREFDQDPENRFFIYHIFDDERGLQVALVPKDKNPNQVAIERGFLDQNGITEWYKTNEHPCLNE